MGKFKKGEPSPWLKQAELLGEISYLRMNKGKSVEEIAKITNQDISSIYYSLGHIGRPLRETEVGNIEERRTISRAEPKILSLGRSMTPEEISKETGISVNTIYYMLGDAKLPALKEADVEKLSTKSKVKVNEIVGEMKKVMQKDKNEFVQLLDRMIETEGLLPDDLMNRIVDMRNTISAEERASGIETGKDENTTLSYIDEEIDLDFDEDVR